MADRIELRIPAAEYGAWRKSEPAVSGDFAADRAAFANFWAEESRLLRQLPKPSERQEADRLTAIVILEAARRYV